MPALCYMYVWASHIPQLAYPDGTTKKSLLLHIRVLFLCAQYIIVLQIYMLWLQ